MRHPSARQWVIAFLAWYAAVVVVAAVFLIVVGAFNEFSLAERLLWGPTMVMKAPYQLFFYDGLRSLWPWLVVHPLFVVPLLAFGQAAVSERR